MVGAKWLPAAFVAGVCLGSLVLTQSAAAATIDPLSASVIAGNSITLTLNDSVSGVGGVDLQVTYDHSLLTLVAVTNGALLVTWDAPTFNTSNGLIAVAENISSDDADGNGSILKLTFAAIVTDPTGIVPITIQTTPGPAVGASGEYQLAAITKSINVTAAATVPPTTVPEPATAMLLLAPMLAAASLTRRNRC